jgi:hypothetical protein
LAFRWRSNHFDDLVSMAIRTVTHDMLLRVSKMLAESMLPLRFKDYLRMEQMYIDWLTEVIEVVSHATDSDTLWDSVSLTGNSTCPNRPYAPDGEPDYIDLTLASVRKDRYSERGIRKILAEYAEAAGLAHGGAAMPVQRPAPPHSRPPPSTASRRRMTRQEAQSNYGYFRVQVLAVSGSAARPGR